jgi:hypothetical protein
MTFAAGQCWTYRAPQGFEASRIVIGAVVTFSGEQRIICCSVIHAPRHRPDDIIDAVTIPFLPMSEQALATTVVAQDGEAQPAEHFREALDAWAADERGLTSFTVPFDGFLDRLIARQMAAIVGRSAA